MGGATTLPTELEQVQGEIYISANQHGHLIRPADYICSIDSTHQNLRIPMQDVINPVKGDAVTISAAFWADIRANDIEKAGPNRFPMNSGVLGLFAASVMGGDPIWAVGFDWYRAGTYHHDPKAASTGKGHPESAFQRSFEWLVKNCPDTRFWAVSGPLKPIFARSGKGSPSWRKKYAKHRPHEIQWTGVPIALYNKAPTQGERYWLSRTEMVSVHSRITPVDNTVDKSSELR